jgi:alpha-L-fucosidase
MPGEVCDTLGKEWFYMEGDKPRLDEELLAVVRNSRARGANLLLDVGPNRHGLIPEECRSALLRLRQMAGL